jgi:hypothetical protein
MVRASLCHEVSVTGSALVEQVPEGDRVVRIRMGRSVRTSDEPTSIVGGRVAQGTRAALLGATPKKTVPFDPGRQVDPLGRQFELTWFPLQRRTMGRDQRALATLKMIRDLDPQASQAVWNFLRLANPGMELQAMVGEGNDQQAEGGPAQAYLDGLMLRIGAEYGGGGDQLHNVLTLSLVTDGAVAAEVAPTDDLKDVYDWYAVEPLLIAFKRDPITHDLILGQQFRDGTWTELNDEQVFYVPLDPDVEDPYGRPPMMSAVSAIMAKAQMLNDVRAAAHAAGYPRIDVEVLWDALTSNAPPDLRLAGRERDLAGWAESQLEALVKEYENMQVDDTFVHYDWVKIKGFENRSGFPFSELDDILTRQVNSALKTLPILLGINETSAESHGSVQWNIQVAAVEALQRQVKRILEKLANVSLQLAGFPAHAHIAYDTIRTIDRLTEAQGETFEFNNLKTAVAMGWMDNDEASEKAVGHPPVGEPIPGALGPGTMPAPVAPAAPAPGATAGTTPGTAGQPQPVPTETTTQAPPKPGTLAAWDLLRSADRMDWSALRTRKRAVKEITGDWLAKKSKSFGDRGRQLFEDAGLILIEELKAEGIVAEFTTAEERDTAGDIADSVFGLGYRREMKALLRDSVLAGMIAAGADPNDIIDEAIVRRIWKGNVEYIGRIRDDLQQAVRDGTFASLPDVKSWLDANVFREEMMGVFLAKQGLAAGYVDQVETANPDENRKWEWQLGEVKTEHCVDCLDRDGQEYTGGELLSIGYPGSGGTECMSNCHCSLLEVPGAAAAATGG